MKTTSTEFKINAKKQEFFDRLSGPRFPSGSYNNVRPPQEFGSSSDGNQPGTANPNTPETQTAISEPLPSTSGLSGNTTTELSSSKFRFTSRPTDSPTTRANFGLTDYPNSQDNWAGIRSEWSRAERLVSSLESPRRVSRLTTSPDLGPSQFQQKATSSPSTPPRGNSTRPNAETLKISARPYTTQANEEINRVSNINSVKGNNKLYISYGIGNAVDSGVNAFAVVNNQLSKYSSQVGDTGGLVSPGPTKDDQIAEADRQLANSNTDKENSRSTISSVGSFVTSIAQLGALFL